MTIERHEDTKRCKFCDEEIRFGATKCKHCGSLQDDSDSSLTVEERLRQRIAELRETAKNHFENKNYEEAEIEIEQAIELDPTDESLKQFLQEIDACIQKKRFAKARSLRKEGKYEVAIVEFRALLKRNPSHAEAAAGLAETEQALEELRDHMAKGDNYRTQGEYQKALAEFEKVLEINPAYVYAKSEIEQCRQMAAEHGFSTLRAQDWLEEAKTDYREKKYKKTIEDAQKILEKTPNHAEALRLLREARNELLKTRKRVLIITAIVLMVGLYSFGAYHLWNLGKYRDYVAEARSALEAGQRYEAIDYGKKALKHKPEGEEALMIVSTCYREIRKGVDHAKGKARVAKKESSKAKGHIYGKELFQEAVKLEDQGKAYLNQEKFEEAKAKFNEAANKYKESEKAALLAIAEMDQLEREKLLKLIETTTLAKHQAIQARKLADTEMAYKFLRADYASAEEQLAFGDEKYTNAEYVEATAHYQEASRIFKETVANIRQGAFLPEGLVRQDGKITNTKDNSEMEFIAGGSFYMGSPAGRGLGNERPYHTINISSFFLDKYEVTIQLYKRFLNETGHRPLPEWVSEYSSGENHPVVGVSWEDAAAYAKWAGKRLPTEAEWEYACGAGMATRYSTGNEITHDDANYSFKGEKDVLNRDVWEQETAPVGSFPPNPWGLYEMHGNVNEWCADWYGRNYYGESPPDNPQGPDEGLEKVVRGGSWSEPDYSMRTANRSFLRPDQTQNNVGFRCAK